MSTTFESMISDGLALRRAVAGTTLSYDDGSNPAESVTGVRGRPDVRLAEALAARISAEYVDWLIPAADLAALDMPPKQGHTITVGGDVYTVTTLEGLPEWSWVDPGETEYRIHTILTTDG